MATCKDCLHYEACESMLRAMGYTFDGVDEVDAEERCDTFADRSRYVVREKGVAAAVMKRLLDGEWVETQEVEDALGIDFSEGMKLFDFGRTAEWNPAPLNGQKITTMFRLKSGENDGTAQV